MIRTETRGRAPRTLAAGRVPFAAFLAMLVVALCGAPASAQEVLPWGASDLDEKILQYRDDHNISSTRNVAVYEIKFPDGRVATIAIDSERHQKPEVRGDRILGHSERRASDILRSYGIKDSWVRRIHSELQPCSLPGAFCQKMIDDRYPNAKVSYTWEYGDTRDSRRRGQAQKVATVDDYYNRRDAARDTLRVPGAKPPAGPLTDALARPFVGRPGGIDFTTLELRYVSDKGPKGGGISYSLAGTPTAGASDPAAGLGAAKRSSDAFFGWLALHPNSFWVNLNPSEPHEIIDPQFGKTDAGHIMLAADFHLKSVMWPLTNPATPSGAEFWRRIDALYGNDRLRANHCASLRTWIESAPATVRETADELHILEAPLVVQLESVPAPPGEGTCAADTVPEAAKAQVYQEVIAPAMTQVVNTAPEFAELRRVYLSRVAAEWVRARADRRTPLGKIIDSGAIDPWAANPPWNPLDIFNQYVAAFRRNNDYSYTRTFEQGGQTYSLTFVMGGVDFRKTPRSNLTKADFRARYPERAKQARDSLQAPRASADGKVWLGAGARSVTQPRVREELGKRQRPGSLRLRARASARRADAGDTVKFALRVRNRGDARLEGIEVCDRLPAGLVFVRANRQHRMRDGRHCWTLARLGAGKSATIRLTARVTAGARGKLRSEATATVDGAPTLGVRARRTVRVVAGAAQTAPAGGVAG